MTNAQAILVGSAIVAGTLLMSNSGPTAVAQGAGPIIPPVEGFVPPGESVGAQGPWHLWRMNRHTGQISFCTATISAGQPSASGQSGSSAAPASATVECTRTSGSM